MTNYRADPEARGGAVPEGRGGLREGTIVGGRYVTRKLLARGGMSSVHLAVHEKLGRYVAHKVFAPAAFDPEEIETFEERFRVEATTLAALDHPHIVTVYDYGETEDGRYYLAMEYVRGPRFSEILKRGPMSPGRVVELVRQVCTALQYAHEQGVVHRDIKLSNLMLREPDGLGEDFVKVVDFGLAKLLEQDQSLTAVGVIMGSPHFMAPEQIRGDLVSPRTDIYAVGILTFCALTGRYPFHARTPAGTLTAHLTEPVPTMNPMVKGGEIPAGLEEVVVRCLAKAEEDRFRDMGDLMAALDTIVLTSSGGCDDALQTDTTEEPTFTRYGEFSASPTAAPATEASWLDVTRRRSTLPAMALLGTVCGLFVAVGVLLLLSQIMARPATKSSVSEVTSTPSEQSPVPSVTGDLEGRSEAAPVGHDEARPSEETRPVAEGAGRAPTPAPAVAPTAGGSLAPVTPRPVVVPVPVPVTGASSPEEPEERFVAPGSDLRDPWKE